MESVLASPERAEPVDLLDRLVDPVLFAIFENRLATRTVPVVVDDEEATDRQPRIEIHERVLRRLVQIAVEPRDRPRAVLQGRQRVLEPALDELHLIVEEAVQIEVALDILAWHRQVLGGMERASDLEGIG